MFMAKSKEIHGPLLGSPVPGPMHRLSLALTLMIKMKILKGIQKP
jgi:hypothetical protein